MAKMFYSLEEAAERLGKTPDDVRGLASSGQLQEFRDRDRLMFKREQVDLLAGDDSGGSSGGSGIIPMSDSRGGSGMSLSLEDSASGSGEIGLDEPSKERSGISIFEVEETEQGDPSAVTRITETNIGGGAPEFTLESAGSGSGLLDLTREGDDTSLGADLLEDVYKSDDDGTGSETASSSGLFETTTAPSDVSAGMASPAMALMAAEPYDGPGSGWVGGVADGITAVVGFCLVATLVGLTDSGSNFVVGVVAQNLMMWLGIFAGVIILSAVVGLLLGKRG